MSHTIADLVFDKENVSPIKSGSKRHGPCGTRLPTTAKRAMGEETCGRVERALRNELDLMSPVKLMGNLDRSAFGPLDQSLLDATINASMNASMFLPGGGMDKTLNLTLNESVLCGENSFRVEGAVFGGAKRVLEETEQAPPSSKRRKTSDGASVKVERPVARKKRTKRKKRVRISKRQAVRKGKRQSVKKGKRKGKRSRSPAPKPPQVEPLPAMKPMTLPVSPIKAAPVKSSRQEMKSVTKSLSKSFRETRSEEIAADEFFTKLKAGPEPGLTRARFDEILAKLHELGRVFVHENTICRV